MKNNLYHTLLRNYHNVNGLLQRALWQVVEIFFKNFVISLLAIVLTTDGGAQPPGLTVMDRDCSRTYDA